MAQQCAPARGRLTQEEIWAALAQILADGLPLQQSVSSSPQAAGVDTPADEANSLQMFDEFVNYPSEEDGTTAYPEAVVTSSQATDDCGDVPNSTPSPAPEQTESSSSSSSTLPPTSPSIQAHEAASVREDQSEAPVQVANPEPLEPTIQAPTVELERAQCVGVPNGRDNPPHCDTTPQQSKQFIHVDIPANDTQRLPMYPVLGTHYFTHPDDSTPHSPSVEQHLSSVGAPVKDGEDLHNNAGIVDSSVAGQVNSGVVHPSNDGCLPDLSNAPLPHPPHPSYYPSVAGPSSYEDVLQHGTHKENIPVSPLAPAAGSVAANPQPVPAAPKRVIAPLPARPRAKKPSARSALPPTNADAMIASSVGPSTVSSSVLPMAEAPLQHADEHTSVALPVDTQPPAARRSRKRAAQPLPSAQFQLQAEECASGAGYKKRKGGMKIKQYTADDYNKKAK